MSAPPVNLRVSCSCACAATQVLCCFQALLEEARRWDWHTRWCICFPLVRIPFCPHCLVNGISLRTVPHAHHCKLFSFPHKSDRLHGLISFALDLWRSIFPSAREPSFGLNSHSAVRPISA